MKLKEWIQSIGKRYGLKNGQGISIGGGVYAKYYETTPQKGHHPHLHHYHPKLITNKLSCKEILDN